MSSHSDDSSLEQTAAVDWSAVGSRSEALNAGRFENEALSEDEKMAIFKERARRYAEVNHCGKLTGEEMHVLVFELAYEQYGIDTAFVREVCPLVDLTPVPGVPAFVLGIVNIRGHILSIVDLRLFFGLPEKGMGQLNKIILLRNGTMEFGILADNIIGAQTVSIDGSQASVAILREIGAEYLRGVTNDGVIILEADRILQDDRILVHQEMD
jgi:purine-binding chemotaxis protein CheW